MSTGIHHRILSLAAAAAVALWATPAAAQTCGVLELTGGGKKITKNVVVNITSLIVSEVDIQGDYEFTMQHGAEEFDNGCPGNTSCLNKFASNNGYDRLIVGSVLDGSSDAAYKIKLRLYDPTTTSWERTLEDEVRSSPEFMLSDIPPLVGELLTGERPRTAEEIVAEQEEEDMSLDMDVDLLAMEDDDEDDLDFDFGVGEDDLGVIDLDMTEEEIQAKREEEERRRREEEERERAEQERRDREEEERRWRAEEAQRERDEADRRAREREEDERREEERRAREEEERRWREEEDRREREEAEERRRSDREEEERREREREEDERRERERERSYYDDDEDEDEDLIVISDSDEIVIGEDDEDDYDYYDEDDYYREDEDDYYDDYEDSDEPDDEEYIYGSYEDSYADEDDYDDYDRRDDDYDRRDDDYDDYDRRDSRDSRDSRDDYDRGESRDSRDSRGGYTSSSTRGRDRRDVQDLDGGRRSSGGRATYNGSLDVAHVCIKASAGGVYYYQGFFSYGGDIGIHVHRNVLIDLQFKGWTASAIINNQKKVVTLIPLAIGASYKGMRGRWHPFVGGDLVFVLYQVHPETGARFAPGFKVRGGVDFKVTESFGFFAALNIGFAHAKYIKDIDRNRPETQLIADGTIGLLIQL